jgi:hypothetical protein
MNIKENKSYRSKLVKTIVESFIEEHLFDQTCNVKQELQNMLDSNLKFETKASNFETKLDSNLKFETKASDFQTKNEYNFGEISFKDENGTTRAVHVTITQN